MARIYKWFHCFFDKCIFVFFHSLIKHFIIPITLRNATAENTRFLHTHEHFVILEVEDLAFKLKLFGKIWNNKGRHDLSARLSHLLCL